MMNIVSIEPQGDLKHTVRKFWYATAETSNKSRTTYKILPDGTPGIIFQHCNGHSALLEADGSRLPISFVYGQSTQTCINHLTPNALIVGVDFQPTALKKLFSIDASELTNMLLASEQLFSKQFIGRLFHISNPQLVIQFIAEQLRLKLSSRRQDRIIDESIRLIIQNTTRVDSETLSKHFNLSRRQLQRKFKEYNRCMS
ncbi:MAG TPA: DUF6597 domain-containing transcriptional factor [Flavisolibacter sp.]|nr:DUF6597 domain-containing transcriptional factor [Flavisolibacter sp.]